VRYRPAQYYRIRQVPSHTTVEGVTVRDDGHCGLTNKAHVAGGKADGKVATVDAD